MARSIRNYTVNDQGRDSGKVFVLTEMPASRSEAWAVRVLLALAASGADMPEGFERMGMAGVAQMGLKALAGLRWEIVEPLLAEMWACIQIMPDPLRPQIVRPLIEEDVEETATRFKLRDAVLELHVGFSLAAALSKSMAPAAAPAKPSRSTKTSPP